MRTPEKPVVLVYRSEILPYSETFVLNQATSLSRYQPVLVGRHRKAGLPLGDTPSVTASPRSRPDSRLRAQLVPPFRRTAMATLRDLAPALVHAHFGPDALTAEPLARSLGLPLIVTFHGYDASRSTSLAAGPVKWLYGRRLPGLTRRAARVIAVSDHIRGQLIDRGCEPDKVVTHYNGVDTTWFSPSDGQRESGLVVAVGRFVEKKGFGELIQAFRAIDDSRAGMRLVIIGTGDLDADLKGAAAGDDRIEFLGAQSPQAVRDWLRRASALAVPSVTASDGDTEGLPTIVIEAMACGVAVVGTRHAGIPEAVIDGQTGVLVDERDIAALTTALLTVAGDASRAQTMGRLGRERAVTHFDRLRLGAQLEDIYDAALKRTT